MRAQALVLADSQAAKPARTDSPPAVVLRRVPDQIGGQGLGRTAGLPLSGTRVLPGQTISHGASCDPRATSALTGSTFWHRSPGLTTICSASSRSSASRHTATKVQNSWVVVCLRRERLCSANIASRNGVLSSNCAPMPSRVRLTMLHLASPLSLPVPGRRPWRRNRLCATPPAGNPARWCCRPRRARPGRPQTCRAAPAGSRAGQGRSASPRTARRPRRRRSRPQ